MFLHLFAKNAKANLTRRELEAYQEAAALLGKVTDAQWTALVLERNWIELDYERFRDQIP